MCANTVQSLSLSLSLSRNISGKHLLSDACHGRIQRDPLKNHKNIGFPSNIDPDPLKSQSYQASIQWWANDTPAKHRFKGVSLIGRWWSIFSGNSVFSHRRQFNFNRAGSNALHACADLQHATFTVIINSGWSLARLFMKERVNTR